MNIKYRPEIDGLRTVAVVAVIIYHAEFLINGEKLLSGGFFGVDVFFVISGFLITSLMMKEFHHTGTISISSFYSRRARRLLPALLVVILASMPFAWVYLLPSQLVDFAKSLISSLAFGSNFYWYHSFQEYGAESGLLKPFLHTWSLAIEEQYYIVFPIILLAIYKWHKTYAVPLLTAGLILSLLFAQWMTPVNASFSFYMLPSRFWELLVGALLANILHLHPQKKEGTLLTKTMPIVGLLLIIYSFIFIGFDSGHPGFVTLIPVLGTMLIIWFPSEKDLVIRTLSSKYFVSIGLISYSLYLWHYPIFAFFRIDGLFASNFGRAAAISLTFLLSIASVKFIENPLRNRRTVSNNSFFLLVVLLSSIVLISSVIVIKHHGFEDRFKSVSGLLNYEPDNKKLRSETITLLKEINSQQFDPLKEKVLIVGNSHSRDMFNAFYQNSSLFSDFDFRTKRIQIGCFDTTNSDNDSFSKAFFDSEHYKQSQIIVVSNRFGRSKCHRTQNDNVVKSHSLNGLPYLIEKSLRDKKKVLIFGQSVNFPIENSATIVDSIISQKGPLNLIAEDRELFTELFMEINSQYFEHIDRDQQTNETIKEIANELKVPFLDKFDFICDEKNSICFGLTPSGHKSFTDGHHLTLEGAKLFGERMAKNGVIDSLKQ